jgi:hypothetical protein
MIYNDFLKDIDSEYYIAYVNKYTTDGIARVEIYILKGKVEGIKISDVHKEGFTIDSFVESSTNKTYRGYSSDWLFKSLSEAIDFVNMKVSKYFVNK